MIRRILSPTFSDRPARCRRLLFCLIAAFAIEGCRHEPEIEFPAPKVPIVRLIQPQHRKIVRVVGQPSLIRATTYVDLSQADRLHLEVGRGHRRQGEEGRSACHALRPRAGRGARDKKKAAVVLDQERIALAKEVVEWTRPRSKRPRPLKRPRAFSKSTKPRSTAGIRKSSGSSGTSPGSWSMHASYSSRPISSNRASRRKTRQRRPSRGRRRNFSLPRPRSRRARSTSGSPRPP